MNSFNLQCNFVFFVADPIINFLFNCLQEKGLGNAALTALESICTACSSHMTSHLPILIQLTNNLDRFAISNTATISFLKGTLNIKETSNFLLFSFSFVD